MVVLFQLSQKRQMNVDHKKTGNFDIKQNKNFLKDQFQKGYFILSITNKKRFNFL